MPTIDKQKALRYHCIYAITKRIHKQGCQAFTHIYYDMLSHILDAPARLANFMP